MRTSILGEPEVAADLPNGVAIRVEHEDGTVEVITGRDVPERLLHLLTHPHMLLASAVLLPVLLVAQALFGLDS